MGWALTPRYDTQYWPCGSCKQGGMGLHQAGNAANFRGLLGSRGITVIVLDVQQWPIATSCTSISSLVDEEMSFVQSLHLP